MARLVYAILLLMSTVRCLRLGENGVGDDVNHERYLASSLTYVGNNGVPSSGFPLGRCEGDCDSDADCASGLKCFQRSGTQKVPGCSGTGNSGDDYCYDPSSSSSASLTIVGNNGNPSSVFPLGKCKGDCDRDSDCKSGLQCFQRNGKESVPGCSGTGVSGEDYCYDPSDGGDSISSGSSGFRLKMYWQQGYFWQEETFERKWCLNCNTIGSNCTIHPCGSGSDHFQFIQHSGNIQIKLSETNYCLQFMTNSFVHLQPCSSSNTAQRWTGSFSSSKFEISPVRNSNLCVTSPHHPRDGESVSCYRCAVVRTYDTTNWNKY